MPRSFSVVFAALAAGAAGAALVAAGAAPAEARIACRDGFQKSGGDYIATPYCQDQLLADVARQHGMKVSAARIRENPNYKREVCRMVGNDIRVSHWCQNENPRTRGRPF